MRTLTGRISSRVLVAIAAACGTSSGSSSEEGEDASANADSHVAIDGSSGEDTGANAADASSGSVVRPLGTVADEGVIACPAGALAGATCRKITVTCDSVAPIGATIAVAEPSIAVKGTVAVHAGSGGTAFFDKVADEYLTAGFRIVQVAWDSAWELNTAKPSLKAAACRPATAFRWAFDKAHGAKRDVAFCVQGHSGGAGAISYALAHYGLSDTIDFAMITAGPPFGRVDCGCDLASCSVPASPVCPNTLKLGYENAATPVDEWEGTSSCGKPTPPEADRAKWAADSVVSPGANYTYPTTKLSAWYCSNRSQNTTVLLGGFYVQNVPDAIVHCIEDGCKGENVYEGMLPDGTTKVNDAMLAELKTQCIPRHST